MKFIDQNGSFTLNQPAHTGYLYFPLASETGLMSSITPNLGGDAKKNQETFLLEPVSSENLHNNRSTRNFWIVADSSNNETGKQNTALRYASVTGADAAQEAAAFTEAEDPSSLSAGFMWHKLTRTVLSGSVEAVTTSFIPVNDSVEIMLVELTNLSNEALTLTPYAAIPIFGRSADNIRDHRNVTSMLHRISVKEHGIEVCPTMSFDERGHRRNHEIYYVYGYGQNGEAPVAFYPTVESFIGEGGTFTAPRAIKQGTAAYPGVSVGATEAGKEAMGAFRFAPVMLAPGETTQYVVLLGTESSEEAIKTCVDKYDTADKALQTLNEVREYWTKQVNVDFHTSQESMDRLMKWVCFQPFLRRIFGCSFLPHHDYGRGGRGWRDLWQDCLSLLLMDPGNVGQMIYKNFGGVRIDGTNATIIGAGDGNFIADRNGIARVWMDHALWPQMTTKLYIDQTGDIDILLKEAPYFKDAQTMRGNEIDTLWAQEDGNRQQAKDHSVHQGSVLEHLLLQQLTTFYDIGSHNIYRLRGADWNDALDMAAENGESVAFTCAYAGNLRDLAQLIRRLDSATDVHSVTLIEEIATLLAADAKVYDSIQDKASILNKYLTAVRHEVSGKTAEFALKDLADNLEQKADWLTEHLRAQEWIDGRDGEGWFNSYYDNHSNRVEGYFDSGVRMMLTGQVFSIMGNVASDEQVARIVKAADRHLYKKEIGGYRLNTDFHELKFDMGRMFGFAYGEKENGAVFSHMTVMFANALYRRGFAKEGWKALKTLADHALDFDASHIYPGIPEYFRADGRGMYHYLTGAASWFMMTMITEVFGVKGSFGDLLLEPRLTAEQFDENGEAAVSLVFAGHPLTIIYKNTQHKEYGSYHIAEVTVGDAAPVAVNAGSFLLPREAIKGSTITVVLD